MSVIRPWELLAGACCFAVMVGVVIAVVLAVNHSKNKNRPGG